MPEIKLGKKTAYVTVLSPKGELIGFNAIFEPSVKFNKQGVYNANILISKEEGEKLLEIIKQVQTEQFKNFRQKNDKKTEILALKPYTTIDDEGNEIIDSQGRYILKAKANAQIKEGVKGYSIAVFDSKLHPIKKLNLGEGSIVRLKLDLSGYSVGGKVGVSIKLVAVQVIKYVAYSGSNSAVEGFEEEEGFELAEEDVTEETTTDEFSGDTEEEAF